MESTEDKTYIRQHYTITRELETGDECESDITIILTDEGVIVDVVDAEGNILSTWAATAQEFYDNLISGK